VFPFHCPDDKPSPVLDNLLQCIHSDEFDVQQEAVRALEQACLDTSVLHLLASPALLASIVAPLARELERLLRVPSSDVPLCVARIVSAITDAHNKQCALNGYVRCVLPSNFSCFASRLKVFPFSVASTTWCMRGWTPGSLKPSMTSR